MFIYPKFRTDFLSLAKSDWLSLFLKINKVKCFKYRFSPIIFVAMLSGCAPYGPIYTRADYVRAQENCTKQADEDKDTRHPRWFTRWLACLEGQIMPIEIFVYSSKENEIRQMYKKLLVLGEDVDHGKSRIGPVYRKWDRMMEEMKMAPCFIKVMNQDGSEICYRL